MDLLTHAPRIEIDLAEEVLNSSYGIRGLLSTLPSERDQNFLVSTTAGKKLVMKIVNAAEDRDLTDAQNKALIHASSRLAFTPQLVATIDGASMSEVQAETGTHHVRVVTYLEGVPLAQVKLKTTPLLNDIGKKLGAFDKVFEEFNHNAFHRDFHWDIANGVRVVSDYLSLVQDRELRQSISSFVDEFQVNFCLVSQELRKSIIHADANDHNVIIRDERVVGLIDFGDMIFSYTVADPAIAIAYLILDHSDPLSVAVDVLTGYFTENSLNKAEVELVWDLALLRLCMSVCLAERQERAKPDNEYLTVSQKSIRRSLPRLLSISRDLAIDTLRHTST